MSNKNPLTKDDLEGIIENLGDLNRRKKYGSTRKKSKEDPSGINELKDNLSFLD